MQQEQHSVPNRFLSLRCLLIAVFVCTFAAEVFFLTDANNNNFCAYVQSNEVRSGINGLTGTSIARSEAPNGNAAAASGAPKPRIRARRGQATDPHSIAERVSQFIFFPCLNSVGTSVSEQNG